MSNILVPVAFHSLWDLLQLFTVGWHITQKGQEALKKIIWSRIWLIIGTIFMVIYIGGMVYIRHDFLTNEFYRYGSMPVSISYALHSIFFFVPGVICFAVSFVLHRKNR